MPKQNRIYLTILIHLAVWAIVVFVPFLLHPHHHHFPHPYAEMLERARKWNYIVSTSFAILLFYFNYFWAIPKFLLNKKQVGYIGLMLVTILMVYGVLLFIAPRITHHDSPELSPVRLLIKSNVIAMLALVWGVSSAIRVLQEWYRIEEQQKARDALFLSTELSFLKAQINPHFLFNTLNTLYALSLRKSESTPSAILKLSHIMRYVMQDAQQDKVPLNQEISYLKDYISLQELRLTDKSPVTFTIQGNPDKAQIAPLLLLPFVENAFKYGVSNSLYSPIQIRLDITPHQITFFCKNLLLKTTANSTEIGLSNVKRRLELLYPNQYQLYLIQNEFYEVHLTLNRISTKIAST